MGKNVRCDSLLNIFLTSQTKEVIFILKPLNCWMEHSICKLNWTVLFLIHTDQRALGMSMRVERSSLEQVKYFLPDICLIAFMGFCL